MSIYLGIDVGTQSVKALCFDAESRKVLAQHSAELDLISHSDGTREQRVEWWEQGIAQCCAQIEPNLKRAVVAIGVSGQQHGFVPLDESDKALTPVKLWCDTTTAAECEEINSRFGGQQRCIDELGNAILPGYTAPKIRWLKNHNGAAYEQLHTILLPHDYVNLWLTGERTMEAGDASGTGMLDVRARTWHSGMLAAIDADRDLSECLPELSPASACIGKLRVDIAEQLGLTAGIPVSSGGGDNMMAAIGTGNVAPGRMTISLGTSGTLHAYSQQPVVDNGGDLAAFCDSTGGWLPLLCTMNCTVSTELTRNLLQLATSEIDQRIENVPAGANGVMTLPFFNGERTPNLPNAKACLLGLDGGNYTPDNLLRSAMESSIYGLRVGLEAFRKKGFEVSQLRLTGGGANSLVWQQIVADVFDVPVSVPKIDEAAAFGAALQAAWMHQSLSGNAISIADIADANGEINFQREPDQNTVARYNELYKAYLNHVDVISALYT